jgi:putative ABC transport system ATP-binding protein
MTAILEMQNVGHFYTGPRRKTWVLQGLSQSFEQGRFYTILGPSGSGKTTMLSLASGLESPSKGKVLYRGQDLMELGLGKYRNKHAATIFQSYNLLTYMTAVRNVTTAMEVTGAQVKNRKARAAELLTKVGLDEQDVKRNVLQLSGGQQQRVAIARALACDVEILFADEPTGNLDSETSEEIIGIFQELAHEQGKCVIVVTHSAQVANRSDTVLTLAKGKFRG